MFFILTYIFFGQKKDDSQPMISTQKKELKKYEIDVENLKIDGRKVIGLPPGKEKESLSKIQLSNRPSTEWDEKLEKTIRSQGGDGVKDVQLKSVDSFIWTQDGQSLFVESVIVTLKKPNNEEISFRVLVDSQTGKILKNWDQPIFDPANPRDNFKIKIDPRYHNGSDN
jgi:hypothetical protein